MARSRVRAQQTVTVLNCTEILVAVVGGELAFNFFVVAAASSTFLLADAIAEEEMLLDSGSESWFAVLKYCRSDVISISDGFEVQKNVTAASWYGSVRRQTTCLYRNNFNCSNYSSRKFFVKKYLSKIFLSILRERNFFNI